MRGDRSAHAVAHRHGYGARQCREYRPARLRRRSPSALLDRQRCFGQGRTGGLRFAEGGHPDGDRTAYPGAVLAGARGYLYPDRRADRLCRQAHRGELRRKAMTEKRIIPVVMPKWGLSMEEGKLTGWLVEAGRRINVGEAILEVETDKIAGSVEATDAGLLRRRVGEPGTVYPVKALLAVIADESITDKEIDDYVSSYVTPAAEAGKEGESTPKYEFVDLPDGRIRYAKRGSGDETVILIHGFGGDLDNWLFNIDALAGNATVYALDLPGHGQSVKAIANPSLAVLAMTVVSFMNAMGVKSAHLVGHSLGGAIAMEIAREAKDRVKSLVLISSAGLGPDINIGYING